MATLDDTAAPVAEKSVESSASAVEWASIFGGALAAFGVTIILLTLGPGLGLATVSPWSLPNPSPTTFGTVAAGGGFQVAGWPLEKAETRQGVLLNIKRRDGAWNGHYPHPH